MTDLPDDEAEANEADLLEQATEVDGESPALADDLLDDPLVEADEADLLEQSQDVLEEDPDERR